MISAKIIEDSIAGNDCRLTTLELKYPRFIHSEVMTHRVFSRNAASSRAIPIKKVIDQVINNPAKPIHWGTNKPGMQAGEELPGFTLERAQILWATAALKAAELAQRLSDLNLHKQVVNRILEPFQIMTTIVSATDWDNFFELRISPLAQPEIRDLAEKIQFAMDESKPKYRTSYHLPFITEYERDNFKIDVLRNVSAARCARVSYLNHDGSSPDIKKDQVLANSLMQNKHASPFEHVARPLLSSDKSPSMCRNFDGWIQYRAEIGL